MVDKKDLDAGFTGTPVEPPEGLAKVVQSAASGVKREVHAVTAGARNHPHTASALLLSIGILAFGFGYLLGRSSVESAPRPYWR
ncbi:MULTISPECIES: hypothetical protein [Rhizobium]|uniref:hypothetical protein n=1 Tax=Rhizobium TaxID=379 RepID=UPI0007EBDFC5|nr:MULTISPECIES: hypothetical protein [Rhizobium]ANK87782.1 hypothetical protein AMK02_PA00004 [Rhizobium sp. N731]ANK94998.1 hypothetical protein AMK01_PD00116 [Rhizobium sp. N6212]ANL01050.1 hypothetical protein AMK00_PD00116 [Rhizobium sp. N621]ANL07173.1 hypothetical protein AMJ99_PD00118 [Rhizobium esperanzae]ANL13342.1 hypothetical protein AMJ98_PE00117 [Rhizobium sp. N1341]